MRLYNLNLFEFRWSFKICFDNTDLRKLIIWNKLVIVTTITTIYAYCWFTTPPNVIIIRIAHKIWLIKNLQRKYLTLIRLETCCGWNRPEDRYLIRCHCYNNLSGWFWYFLYCLTVICYRGSASIFNGTSITSKD